MALGRQAWQAKPQRVLWQGTSHGTFCEAFLGTAGQCGKSEDYPKNGTETIIRTWAGSMANGTETWDISGRQGFLAKIKGRAWEGLGAGGAVLWAWQLVGFGLLFVSLFPSNKQGLSESGAKLSLIKGFLDSKLQARDNYTPPLIPKHILSETRRMDWGLRRAGKTWESYSVG